MSKKIAGKSTGRKSAALNKENSQGEEIYVIGIGASAGGLEALQEFLSHLPPELPNAAIIIAQHLSPTHKSMLVQLLSRNSKLMVKEAEDQAAIEPNIAYITPPDTEIWVSEGRILHRKPENPAGPKPSVNVLFHSLAAGKKSKAIGVILSGTGSDGAQGIIAIRKAGGITLVQDPGTARYDGMPQAAIDTGHVDEVLPPGQMGSKIKELLKNRPRQLQAIQELETPGPAVDRESLEKIFALLSKRTGTDFSSYKQSTIGRRFDKRLAMLKMHTPGEYLAFVENNPTELDELFKICLIGVTSFFRDQEVFGELELQLEKVISGKGPRDPVRIWVAGCATGEEAYTLAIIATQLLKKKLKYFTLQVFATDIDEKAIAFARKGIYTTDAVEFVPKELLSTYFIKRDDSYEVVKGIRSAVLFTKHDITRHPPFLKLDLVSCRNLLIYFNAGLQQRIIPLFQYSLNPNGILLLGKSESIGSFTDLFSVLHEGKKLYQRKRGGNLSSVRLTYATGKQPTYTQQIKKEKPNLSIAGMVKETFFNTFEHPYVVINDNYEVLEIHGDVRLYLTLQQGSMSANIVKMANNELQIELRAIISRAIRNKEQQKSDVRRVELFGQTHFVRIVVKPLLYTDEDTDLFVVIFEAFSLSELSGQPPKSSGGGGEVNARITEMEQELISNKLHLQTYIEELETANEEMQSLNEEMQSANEELQSTTEELETSNEELQSTSEEIQIAYAELQATHEELEMKEQLLRLKDVQQMALLNNTLQSFILTDAAYQIIAFNDKARQVIESVFDKPLVHGGSIIDTIEPDYLQTFLKDFKKVLAGETITGERMILDVRSNPLWFRFNYTPVIEAGEPKVVSVSLLDITDAKTAQTALHKTEKLLTAVFDSTNVGICITDKSGKFIDANKEYCQIYGYTRGELIGTSFTQMLPPEMRKQAQKMHNLFIKRGSEIPGEWQVQRKDGSLIDVFVSAELLEQPGGERFKVTSVRNITETKKYKNLLTETQSSASVGGWELDPDQDELILTQEAYLLLDLSPGQPVLLKEFRRMLEKGDNLRLEEALRQAWKTGSALDMELEFYTSGGKSKWLRVTCKPMIQKNKTIKLFGTFQDISIRKRSELLLLQSENKYRSIIENSVNAVFLTQPDGQILEANLAAERMFGYKVDEFRKIGRFAILDHEDPRLAAMIETRTKTGKVRGELTGIRKNGERFPCEASSVVFSDIKGEPKTSTTIADISERKTAEREFALLMHNTEENFVLLDKKLRIVTFNDQFKKNYKTYLGAEVKKGESILDFAPPDRRKATAEIYKKVLSGSVEESEIHVPEKRGSGKDFHLRYKPARDEKGEIIGAFVTISDITSRKTAEEGLKVSEKRYRALVENGGDAVVVLSEVGQPTYVSSSIRRVLGYTENEALQLNVFSILHPADLEGVNLAFERTMSNPGIPVEGHTARMLHKDGSWRYVEATLTNMLHDPVISGIIDNFRDVTEKVKAAEELRQARYFLEKAQEVGKIGHWISTPATEQGELIWSKQTLRIFGLSEGDFDNKIESFYRLVHPEDLDRVKSAATAAIRNKAPYEIKHRLILPNGSVRWIHQQAEVTLDQDGNAALLIGVVQDITEARLAEKKLVEDRNLLRAIIDNIPDHIFVKDLEHKQTLSNKALYTEVFGHDSEEDSQGKTMFEYFDPEVAKMYQDDDRAVMDSGQAVVEREEFTFTPTGEKIWLLTTKVPLRNEAGEITGLVGISRNITEKYLREQELKQYSERLTHIIESITDGFYTLDKNWTVKFWNKEAERLLGRAREDVVGKNLWEVYPETEIGPVYQEYYRAVEERKSVSFEHFHQASEQWLDLNVYPSKEGVSVFFKDVTERKLSVEKIRIAKEKYDMVAKATNDIVWDLDLLNNTINWGEQIKTSLGYTEITEDTSPEWWTEKLHPDDRERVNIKLRKSISEQIINWSDEYRFRAASGEFRHIFDRGFLIKDANGNSVRMVGAMQDITEQKKAELLLKQLNAQLSVSNLELERFAYVASHDLQEPLRMVSSFLQLLERKYQQKLDDKAREYIRYSVDGAERMKMLIMDLLDYSRVNANTDEELYEWVDLNTICRDVIATFQQEIEKLDAKIETGILPKVLGNKAQLNRLFQNLVGNALKYHQKDVTVAVEIGTDETATEWIIRVKDNGIGIDERFFEKIFVIFQRLHNKSEFSGTGIGLAICKKIVEKHHGKIWVESKINRGSTFFVSLPKQSATA